MSDLPLHTGPCPKCRHVRSAGDVAPPWQCPNCGVAYHKAAAATAKVAEEGRRRQLDHVDGPPAEDAAEQPEKAFPWKIAVVAVTLAAFGAYEYITFQRNKTKRTLEVREAQVRLAQIEQIIEEMQEEKARAKAEATRQEAEKAALARASVSE